MLSKWGCYLWFRQIVTGSGLWWSLLLPTSLVASPDSGRVPLHLHVGAEVTLETFRPAFCDTTNRHLEVNIWISIMCERGDSSVKSLHNGLLLSLVFLSIHFTVCACERVSPERCLVWGPGLNPDIVLPVRYFTIQAVDSNGANLTSSPGKLTTDSLNESSCSTTANVS